jgi:hypothetical protein
MIYNELYHFDGCSYTKGHDLRKETTFTDPHLWKHVINPLVHKDGNFNITLPLNQRYGIQPSKYPFQDFSQIAKSNDMIFSDFIANVHNFKDVKKGRVFIYWSHSERTGLRLRNDKFKGVDIYEKNQQQQVIEQNPSHSFNFWFQQMCKTMDYMYAVQSICENLGIEYYFITQENYNLFKYVSEKYRYEETFNNINSNHIFNWPTQELVNYPSLDDDFTTKTYFLYWGTLGFALQFARAFGGREWVSDDKKHMTYDAHLHLGTMLKDWIEDNEKDLSYWVDECTKINNKRFFYDLRPWKDDVLGSSRHWVEERVTSSLIEFDIKPNAEYIYES